METNVSSATPSIQPASRPSSDNRTIVRRDSGSATSGFAPRTNVSIRNSVNDMAGILSKISADHAETEAAMPKQLQQIINQVMQSAFSVKSSLGEGVGSALESSRFSVEQLTILNRLVEQLSSFAAKGQTGTLSEATAALLENAQSFTENAGLPNGTMLNKLAFQLLNGKTVEELPQELQQLLTQLSGMMQTSGVQGNESQNDGMNFLKQLVDAFFPKSMFKGSSNSGNSQNAQQNMPQQSQQGNFSQQAAQRYENNQVLQQNPQTFNSPSQGTQQGQPQNPQFQQMNQSNTQQSQQGNNTQQSQTGNNFQGTQNGAQSNNTQSANQPANNSFVNQGQPNANQSQSATNNMQGNIQQNAQQNPQGQQMTGNGNLANSNMTNANGSANGFANTGTANNANTGSANANQAGANNTQQSQPNSNENILFRNVFNRQAGGNMPGSLAAMLRGNHTARNNMMNQQPIFQNNAQSMNAMKDLAQLLLKDNTMSMKDTQLLSNFVNGQQTNLSEQEAKQLNLLLRMVQSNVPAALQQAGQQQGMEDLPRLWAFMQLCDLAKLKDMKARDLKNASRQLERFVSSMKGSLQSSGTFQADGQKSLNFMIPLFLGDNEESYPAYIHLYDDEEGQGNNGEKKKETWLRLCVLTENIGAVEMTCRLYEGQNLSMRVLFSDDTVVKDFKEYIPELKHSFKDSALNLTDLKVGSVGNADKEYEE